jgi:hypothetical protein
MAVGSALSKYWTYGKIEDVARLRTGSIAETLLSPTLALDIISMGVQKIAKRLNGAAAPWYMTTNSTLAITGTANPYSVDLSSVAPFIDQVVRVVHVTGGGTRTIARQLQPEEGENASSLSNIYSTNLFYVHEGDGLSLYKLSAFTITTASDSVELKYYRQPKIGSVSSNAVVSDATWTSTGIIITNFTISPLTSANLVGAEFVGVDYAGNPFSRLITKWKSATSFEISSALTVDGVMTSAAYIVPPNSNIYTTTRGTYVDLPDSYASLLLDETVSTFIRLKNSGVGDSALEASVSRQMEDIYTISAREKAQTQAEK